MSFFPAILLLESSCMISPHSSECFVQQLYDYSSYKALFLFLKNHLEMEWLISDSYCSFKPLLSGMAEVVPARTSSTLHPPSLPTVL